VHVAAVILLFTLDVGGEAELLLSCFVMSYTGIVTFRTHDWMDAWHVV